MMNEVKFASGAFVPIIAQAHIDKTEDKQTMMIYLCTIEKNVVEREIWSSITQLVEFI